MRAGGERAACTRPADERTQPGSVIGGGREVARVGRGAQVPIRARLTAWHAVVLAVILTIVGAGLGLAICRDIVKAHRGRIWVEDNDPRGSRFVVALPLEAVERNAGMLGSPSANRSKEQRCAQRSCPSRRAL